MNKIKKAIQFIFAENEGFSLENRLFLSSIVVGILTSLVGSAAGCNDNIAKPIRRNS